MGRVVADAEGDFSGFRTIEPDFRTVGIVGLGLIGGSLALAIRERWPQTIIVGVDRPEVLAEAVTRGVIARGAANAGALAAIEPAVDLVVLAAPVLQNITSLRELSGAAARPLLVTDVGSTKLSIVHAARDAIRETSNQHLTFVGGHPVAGTAHAGLAHARADLFRGRPWLFTPDAAATAGAQSALQKLQTFVSAIGAEPSTLDPAEHDRVMAYVSHLPQLASSALMRVAGEGVGPAGFSLSGGGLYDTTRLASSPATMWTDILASNAEHVGRALDAFIADLQAIRDQLTSPAATDWLETGARWRARLVSSTNSAAVTPPQVD
jgi:prephenate dehydrogenase